MRQRLIGLRRLRISGWLLVGLFLTSVFLINNRELVSGVRVQIWDAWSFYTPAFSLVADHARNGRLLLRDCRLPDSRAFLNYRSNSNPRSTADMHASCQVRPRRDMRTIVNYTVVIDTRAGINDHVLTDLSGRIDDHTSSND